jgi:Flp pilus assembly CpaE family ATPase
VRLVVNRFSPRQLIPLAEIEKTLGMKVFSTLRNDYQSTMEAINEGRPAVLDKNSIYARDVRKLASEVTGVAVAADKGGGLLGGLFSRGKSSNRSSPGS